MTTFLYTEEFLNQLTGKLARLKLMDPHGSAYFRLFANVMFYSKRLTQDDCFMVVGYQVQGAYFDLHILHPEHGLLVKTLNWETSLCGLVLEPEESS